MRTHIRGWPVYWDPEAQVYRYTDTGQPAEGWGGKPRRCPQCHMMPTPCHRCDYVPEGPNAQGPWHHDPCMGHLEGIASACCGHGVHDGYMRWSHNATTETV